MYPFVRDTEPRTRCFGRDPDPQPCILEPLRTIFLPTRSYWVTQKLPQIYTANHATFPIQICKITVQICGNFWVTQYEYFVYLSWNSDPVTLHNYRSNSRYFQNKFGLMDNLSLFLGQFIRTSKFF